MSKTWDRAIPSLAIWKESLRVLKPGAFAFVMCIPRQDCLARMIVSLEDAGFNVSFTSIFHTFAQGFPKAQNIGKVVDKRLGAKREVVGKYIHPRDKVPYSGNNEQPINQGTTFATGVKNPSISLPATPQAKLLNGSYAGMQLKPSVEVVIVAMKPLSEKTYVDQALANRHGISWLDSARIPSSSGDTFFDSLLKACDSIRDVVSPTILCNKNYIDHVHRVGDSDYSLGRELSRWLAYVQNHPRFSSAVLCGNLQCESQDSQVYCSACSRLYGELSLLVQEDDRGFAPSQSDVLACIRQFALSHKRSHSSSNVHLSSGDGLFHILAGLVLDDNLASHTPFNKLYYHYTSNSIQSQASRFPANIICEDDVLNDGRVRTSGKGNTFIGQGGNRTEHYFGPNVVKSCIGDSGSFSRYFSLDAWWEKKLKELPEGVRRTFPFLIVPKASKAEKNRGCEGLDWEKDNSSFGYHQIDKQRWDWLGKEEERIYKETSKRVSLRARGNIHPTVKPLKLGFYLATIGSREGDVILDPFGGSGWMAVVAKSLGRHYIVFETEKENVKIANSRLSAIQTQLSLFKRG